MDSDYYVVLGVDPDADPKEVRRAFRERVRACHPDRVANLDEDLRRLAEEKMVQLNEAYAVLRNPERRAAYDDHRLRRAAAAAVPADTAPARPGSPHRVARHSERTVEPPPPDCAEETARDRIGDRVFVTRAASEEFESRLRQTLIKHTSWTPVAVGGATLALRATQGRHEDTFVMLAAPALDEKLLRRFLRLLQSCADDLSGSWWRRERIFGFIGAVEFSSRDRLRRALEQFNSLAQGNGGPLHEATLVDLVNWKVVPGNNELGTRLRSLAG